MKDALDEPCGDVGPVEQPPKRGDNGGENAGWPGLVDGEGDFRCTNLVKFGLFPEDDET